MGMTGCDEVTPQLADDGPTVHFTAAGDVGLGSGAKGVLNKVRELAPDFNIILGDLSYEQGAEQKFCDLVQQLLGPEIPTLLVAGNHESNGPDGYISNYVECLPNRLQGLQGDYGKQWYVDVPDENPIVRLIMVSPGLEFPDGRTDYSKGSASYLWTEAAIDTAREAKIPWTIVGMHNMCFSIGHYGCDAGQAFLNLLVRKSVDLVLTGHEHVYQRTFQIGYGDGCPYLFVQEVNPKCVTDSDSSVNQGNGTVFVTNGVGGQSLRDINTEDAEKPYFAAWSGANYSPAKGTAHVVLDSTHMRVDFIPSRGYEFQDSFRIER
ncbi:metallophosphoesterase [Arthrobacter sp. AD-310]